MNCVAVRKNMIIAIVVSSVAVMLAGAVVGSYIWKRMAIQKKRNGTFSNKNPATDL